MQCCADNFSKKGGEEEEKKLITSLVNTKKKMLEAKLKEWHKKGGHRLSFPLTDKRQRQPREVLTTSVYLVVV